jgi:glycosyltransferase involved in cell wall biosynthesis
MILIGPAPENTDFEQITHIRYVDSASELATYYAGAMALFNPSMEESFGMVTAEALACGTPVIVFDSTASPELVGEKCGYVVNPHDLDAVVGCLEEIRENGKDFYTCFCRKRAETLFSREANCEEYRKLYCELAKGTEV